MLRFKLTPFAKKFFSTIIVLIAIASIGIGFMKAGIFNKAKSQVYSVFNKNDSQD